MLSPHASRAPAEVRKADLSPAGQRLVALLERLRFGRIHNLAITGGEPSFHPAPQVIRTLKIAGKPAAAPKPAEDCVLRREILDLLQLLSHIGDGMITRIEVAHGLPLFVELPEEIPAI